MSDDKITILKHLFHIDGFVRTLFMRLFHSVHQRLPVTFEILVVMNKIGSNELLISGFDIPATCHLQERCSHFFVRHYSPRGSVCIPAATSYAASRSIGAKPVSLSIRRFTYLGD